MPGYKAQFWGPRNKGSYRCLDCGRSREEAAEIDVHHIDGNHDRDDDHNLTGLCRRCHLQGRHESEYDLPSAFDPPEPTATGPASTAAGFDGP